MKLIVLVLALLAVSAHSQPTYEYKRVNRTSVEELNRLGAEGWLLVAATEDDKFGDFYLMRQK